MIVVIMLPLFIVQANSVALATNKSAIKLVCTPCHTTTSRTLANQRTAVPAHALDDHTIWNVRVAAARAGARMWENSQATASAPTIAPSSSQRGPGAHVPLPTPTRIPTPAATGKTPVFDRRAMAAEGPGTSASALPRPNVPTHADCRECKRHLPIEKFSLAQQNKMYTGTDYTNGYHRNEFSAVCAVCDRWLRTLDQKVACSLCARKFVLNDVHVAAHPTPDTLRATINDAAVLIPDGFIFNCEAGFEAGCAVLNAGQHDSRIFFTSGTSAQRVAALRCSECRLDKAPDQFTNSQKKRQGSRKCSACVDDRVFNPAKVPGGAARAAKRKKTQLEKIEPANVVFGAPHTIIHHKKVDPRTVCCKDCASRDMPGEFNELKRQSMLIDIQILNSAKALTEAARTLAVNLRRMRSAALERSSADDVGNTEPARASVERQLQLCGLEDAHCRECNARLALSSFSRAQQRKIQSSIVALAPGGAVHKSICAVCAVCNTLKFICVNCPSKATARKFSDFTPDVQDLIRKAAAAAQEQRTDGMGVMIDAAKVDLSSFIPYLSALCCKSCISRWRMVNYPCTHCSKAFRLGTFDKPSRQIIRALQKEQGKDLWAQSLGWCASNPAAKEALSSIICSSCATASTPDAGRAAAAAQSAPDTGRAATDGASAALPFSTDGAVGGWKQYISRQGAMMGKPYFYNFDTKETTWTRPACLVPTSLQQHGSGATAARGDVPGAAGQAGAVARGLGRGVAAATALLEDGELEIEDGEVVITNSQPTRQASSTTEDGEVKAAGSAKPKGGTIPAGSNYKGKPENYDAEHGAIAKSTRRGSSTTQDGEVKAAGSAKPKGGTIPAGSNYKGKPENYDAEHGAIAKSTRRESSAEDEIVPTGAAYPCCWCLQMKPITKFEEKQAKRILTKPRKTPFQKDCGADGSRMFVHTEGTLGVRCCAPIRLVSTAVPCRFVLSSRVGSQK